MLIVATVTQYRKIIIDMEEIFLEYRIRDTALILIGAITIIEIHILSIKQIIIIIIIEITIMVIIVQLGIDIITNTKEDIIIITDNPGTIVVTTIIQVLVDIMMVGITKIQIVDRVGRQECM